MARDDKLTLARAAVALRGRGPGEWDGLLAALRGLASSAAQAAVTAPAEMVQVAQGRARGLNDLIGLLESAPDSVAKADKAAP